MPIDIVTFVQALAVGVLGTMIVLQAIHRMSTETAQRGGTSAYTCRCGQTFYAEQPAKEHARKTHNAPLQDDEWRYLMTITDAEAG